MFPKKKKKLNKLCLRALPDIHPDLASPRPPTGSWCTHKQAQAPQGTRCSWDRLKTFKPGEVAGLFLSQEGRELPGGFSLQNRFFLLASFTLPGPPGRNRRSHSKKRRTKGNRKKSFIPRGRIPKELPCLGLPHNEIGWSK